ncbi:MAG: coproporphyrinogen dehydrogenase HemZ [Lachnospiraceae bacterium]|nr:coproporphyrinogen dehydrogenase HemZ [Lachnospiraceae bacterium]
MSTINVTVNEKGFEYDIHSLVKAFYPESEVKVEIGDCDYDIAIAFDNSGISIKDTSGKVRIEEYADGEKDLVEDRTEIKNVLKKLVYVFLSQKEGRELPWGTLTGIRPTKIPMTMLNNGVSEDEIRKYMKEVYLLSDEKMNLAIDIAKREKKLLGNIHYKDGYSLYIGIPFCPTTCLYCSFTSYAISSWKKRVDEYLDALCHELEYVAKSNEGNILDTIYIGGGTPTTLEPEHLERLLSKIVSLFNMDSIQEFTIEAGRPDSITPEKLDVIRKYPVTRISVNPQTMNQKTLDLIGRRHSVEQVKEAFQLARSKGFNNINMDIILGLPGEDIQDVAYTIDEIKKLNPDSLTIHSLAIKRASKLAQVISEKGFDLIANSGSTDAAMEVGAAGTKAMGMEPYYLYRQKNMSGNLENVGFSKEGKEGIYNILIMEEVQTIIACGAGTVTKRVYPGDGVSGPNIRIERCDNVKDVALYIEKIDEMINRKRELFKD